MKMLLRTCSASLLIAPLLGAMPASAQEAGGDAAAKPPMRTRVTLGPQTAPRYAGAKNGTFFPVINIDRSRRPEFEFSAPDESGGFNVWRSGGFAVGPAFNFQGSRRRQDTDNRLARVGFTLEVGGSVQYQINPAFRLRAEARKGVSGHKGWIGMVSADYIARDGDRWLVSLGPRLTFSDRRFNRAYFGVSQADLPTAGLPLYDPGAGLQAVGAAGSAQKQLSERWGVYSFVKYDRLVDDAGASPVVRTFGSRNQVSAGVGVSYTFGRLGG